MADSLTWTRDGARLSLQGELDHDVLVPLWDARAQAMQSIEEIDLSGVTRVDSAGVALLIHLIDDVRKQGRAVRISGKSDNLETLVRLYNLPTDLIP